jgi:hypothetical protein
MPIEQYGNPRRSSGYAPGRAAEPQFKLGAPRPGTSVRDYEAVDNRGRRIAGPSKSYSDMKRAAGTAGVVKFVRPGARAEEAKQGPGGYGEANIKRWMRTHVAEYVDPQTGEVNITKLAEDAAYEASRSEWLDDPNHPIWDWAIEAAELYNPNARVRRPGASEAKRGSAQAAGEQYAEKQIKSTHFDDWVRDQLIEASKMPEDQVLPLETPDDARKIARRMLQQLEWDAKRDSGDADVPEGQEEAFWRGFHKYCMEAVPWLADELLTLNREMRGAAEVRARPKAKRSARKKRR